MLGQMVSGVLLSQHVFVFLSVSGYTSFARTLHLLGTYWGFALMSLHLGLHWNMMGIARRPVKAFSLSIYFWMITTVPARRSAELNAMVLDGLHIDSGSTSNPASAVTQWLDSHAR